MATVANQNQTWQASRKLQLEVTRLVEERRSGTLFIRTQDGHWGCFVFDGGAIVSLMCRGVRGKKSLKYLREINACTFRFDPEVMLGDDSAYLPGSHAIIVELWESASDHRQGHVADSEINFPNSPVALTAVDLKRAIVSIAVDLLGPLGEIVCEERFINYGLVSGMEDVRALAAKIALEFDDLDDALEFQQRVMAAASTIGHESGDSETAVVAYQSNLDYSKFRDVLESEAAEILGPMALELCAEYFSKYAAGEHIADVTAIIDSLAGNIDDPNLAEQFRVRIAARLKSGQS